MCDESPARRPDASRRSLLRSVQDRLSSEGFSMTSSNPDFSKPQRAWRGPWPQPNPKHYPSASLRTRIRNPKPAGPQGPWRGWSPGWLAPLAPQIRITETQNSKQTITSYFDGGYGSRIRISSKKNKKLKDCSTESQVFVITQTDHFSRKWHDKSLFDSDIAQYVIPVPHRGAG